MALSYLRRYAKGEVDISFLNEDKKAIELLKLLYENRNYLKNLHSFSSLLKITDGKVMNMLLNRLQKEGYIHFVNVGKARVYYLSSRGLELYEKFGKSEEHD